MTTGRQAHWTCQRLIDEFLDGRAPGRSLAAMTLPLARRIAVSFPALRHRDFRLLWIGQLFSFAGSRMQTAAILWHVSLLAAPGRKGIALGLVGAVQVVPIIAFSMLSGVVADALDRRKVMLATQTIMALFGAALAALSFAGLRVVWPIYLLAAMSSAAACFDGPARQALIPNLVPREHLASAIGLNTLMFQFASVAGPTLAGLVMAYAIDRIERRGAVLLWAVAAYGAATVVFGISRGFWLTLVCLAAVGGADTVSTVIRNLIRQLETPDELRGRMTGVNMIFFMGGPQLGELEAGVVAQLFGAVASVVSGGLGCLLATALVARRETRLRHYRL